MFGADTQKISRSSLKYTSEGNSIIFHPRQPQLSKEFNTKETFYNYKAFHQFSHKITLLGQQLETPIESDSSLASSDNTALIYQSFLPLKSPTSKSYGLLPLISRISQIANPTFLPRDFHNFTFPHLLVPFSGNSSAVSLLLCVTTGIDSNCTSNNEMSTLKLTESYWDVAKDVDESSDSTQETNGIKIEGSDNDWILV